MIMSMAMPAKYRAIVHLRQSLINHFVKHHEPSPKSIHTQHTAASDVASPICNLLRNGGRWDALTAKFSSIQVTDSLVQTVLLNLKDPANANKALLFFHWSSNRQHFHHALHSYCIAIHILFHAGLLVDAQALLESAINQNSEPCSTSSPCNSIVVDALLGTYEVALPGPRVFDLLIQTYAKMRMIEHAFDACRRMADHGFLPSLISFNTLLHVAQKSNRVNVAWEVYEYMLGRRVYPDQNTVQTMTAVMCKEGTLQKMINVLDKIIHRKRCIPGVVVNTALSFKIFDDNRVEEGILLLKRLLQKSMILDVIVYSMIIFARCKTGELKLAYEVSDEMLNRGCVSNPFVYTCFICAHCKAGSVDKAVDLLKEMQVKGLKPYKETYDFLIEGCSRTGRLEECLDFQEKMIRGGFPPDPVICDKMFRKLCEAEEVEKANNILTLLLERGLFAPNEATYTILIDGYGTVGNAQEILKLYYEMANCGTGPGPIVYESSIRNLCRCGKMKEAEKLLSIMESKAIAPDNCIYDAMVSGYCSKGDVQRAFYFYDQMVTKKLEPCAHTFRVLVLGMCKDGIIKEIL